MVQVVGRRQEEGGRSHATGRHSAITRDGGDADEKVGLFGEQNTAGNRHGQEEWNQEQARYVKGEFYREGRTEQSGLRLCFTFTVIVVPSSECRNTWAETFFHKS